MASDLQPSSAKNVESQPQQPSKAMNSTLHHNHSINVNTTNDPSHTNTPADSPILITRHYSPVSPPLSETSTKILLSALSPADSTYASRYYQPLDRQMSLSSMVLKYNFLSSSLDIPWSEVKIEKTEKYKRPFVRGRNGKEVEFNVSHQGGLVCLAGSVVNSTNPPKPRPTPKIQIGIDIVQVTDRASRSKSITTLADFEEWLEIYIDIFSVSELNHLRSPIPLSASRSNRAAPSSNPDGPSLPSDSTPKQENEDEQDKRSTPDIKAMLRRFYTHWALKEAFLKMSGQALLAPWVKEVNFHDVIVPSPASSSTSSSTTTTTAAAATTFANSNTSTIITMLGLEVKDTITELIAYGEDFIAATCVKASYVPSGIEGVRLGEWEGVDLEGLSREVGCRREGDGVLDGAGVGGLSIE